MKARSKALVVAWSSVVGIATMAGCALDASCSPDEVLKNGMCLAKGSGKTASPAPTGDAGAGDGAAVATLTCGPASKVTGAFGTDCQTDANCGCPAPTCAIQPGDAKGFCTHTGCVDDPTVCPTGYHCFDASVLNPDYPQLCVKD